MLVRPAFWLALVAYLLLGSAWAIGLPVNGSYDEKDHIVRAYAVATGQLTAAQSTVDRRGDRVPAFRAPASLLPTTATVDCTWSPRPPRTADCQRRSPRSDATLLPSGAARYSPVYYAAVGLPLAVRPDRTGVLAARLVSALLCALLLAAAVALALRVGARLLVLGVALAATPVTVNLAGAVNPNGVEICAGILTCCALLGLARTPALDPPTVRRLLAGAAVGSLLLLTVRQLGPVLLGMIVVACALAAGPGRLRELVGRSDVRWVLGGAWLAGTAAAAGWLFASRITEITGATRDARRLPLGDALGRILTDRLPFYLDQLVGLFGYGEVDTPRLARPLWYALVAAVAVAGAALGGRRVLAAQLWLLAGALVLLGGLDLWFLPRVGWFSQGRYALPALVGVVLIPAAALGGAAAHASAQRWAVRVAGALVGLLHVDVLARVLTRYERGVAAPTGPFGGAWQPLPGVWPPLLAVAAGALLLAVLVWGAATGPATAPAAGAVPAG